MECDRLRTVNPDLQQGCKIIFETEKKQKALYLNPNDVPDSCWDGGTKFYI